MPKVAIVTGSNKGIGLAIVKGLCQKIQGTVYLTSRDDRRGKQAVDELKTIGLNPKYHQLDIADKDSVKKISDHIQETYGGIDILINNAAIVEQTKFGASYEESKNVIDINYKSILTIQELIYPLVKNGGRILNISSDCGHLSNIRNLYWIERLSKKDLTVEDVNEFVDWFLDAKNKGTFKTEDIADCASVAAYRVAKVALSALTMIQQKMFEFKNISINSMHPGLVQTSMTDGAGFYSVDQAAETPIYIVLEAPESLKGAYVWHDKKVLDWYEYTANYYFKISSLHDY